MQLLPKTHRLGQNQSQVQKIKVESIKKPKTKATKKSPASKKATNQSHKF